jgi:hypothetical protein
MESQRVTRFRAFDIERSGLRIDARILKDLGWQVLLRSYLTRECILCPDLQDRTRFDAEDRVDAAERPSILIGSRGEPPYLSRSRQ